MKNDQINFETSNNEEHCCNGHRIRRTRILTGWFLTISVLVLVVAICLGYLLDPKTLRILWLALSAVMLVTIIPLAVFIRHRITQCIDEKCADHESRTK